MKYLRVTMPDGSKWDVPAEIIADRRAAYYAKLDADRGYGEYNELYRDELKASMDDHDLLIDWASNNMNWSDVAHAAVRTAPTPLFDFEEGWMNGPKEVVDL